MQARLRGVTFGWRTTRSTAAPVVDLAIRIYLAQVVAVPAVMGAMAHSDARSAGAAMMMAMGPTAVAASGGLGALLLSLGLFTRLAAASLLAALAGSTAIAAGHSSFLLEVALLGWFIVRGPGALSIDQAIAIGVEASALPFSGPVTRGLAALRRHVAPIYIAGLRIFAALAALGIAGSYLPPLLPEFALPIRVALAMALFIGLGLPLALLFAIAALTTSMAMLGADTQPLWAALLVLVMIADESQLAVDRLIGAWLHDRIISDCPQDLAPDHWPNVVIVGAGFGGLACAMKLRAQPVRVTLIDRHNFHLFQPLLYQIATGGLSPADVATPVRGMFARDGNVHVRLGEVTGVDSDRKCVVLGCETLPYDFLVLATGSTHSYFGRDEWADFAPGLKRIEDGVRARNALLEAFERAEGLTDPDEIAKLLTFVIIGGGPTGVEIAGAIAELARSGLRDHFRAIDPAQARIVLVHAGRRILPAFPERLSTLAEASLAELGVEVRTGVRVTEIDEAGVVAGSEHIAAGSVLWAAGVAASPAAIWLDASQDKAGRVIVGSDLTLPQHSNIFAIGDTAASMAWNGEAVPGLAPAAKQGGAYVASVIAARIKGRAAPPPFRYRHLGSLATIGRRSAVADFGFAQFSGALAWWLWGAVHVAFLVGVRNRLAVMLSWGWRYLSYRLSVQLITSDRPAIRTGAGAEV